VAELLAFWIIPVMAISVAVWSLIDVIRNHLYMRRQSREIQRMLYKAAQRILEDAERERR
jgi:urate oxidase